MKAEMKHYARVTNNSGLQFQGNASPLIARPTKNKDAPSKVSYIDFGVNL